MHPEIWTSYWLEYNIILRRGSGSLSIESLSLSGIIVSALCYNCIIICIYVAITEMPFLFFRRGMQTFDDDVFLSTASRIIV